MHRLVGLVLLLAGCHTSDPAHFDAGPDLPPRDTAPQVDVPSPRLTIDFSIDGCPDLSASNTTCKGYAPLTLRFVPIASVGIQTFQWDFGDGSAIEPGEAPLHTYNNPSTYSVRVIGTDALGNTVAHEARNLVVVSPNVTGAACLYSYQCTSPSSCLCPVNATCGKGPTQGMCTKACQGGDCEKNAVCANLAPSTPPTDGREAWQGKYCLASCEADQDCPSPLRCRFLPGPASTDPWVHGCFTSFPVELGASCMDENGRLRDDLCAGGECIAFGYKGLCAKECAAGTCPSDSACAVFGNGLSACLRQCSSTFKCDHDPALACEAPGPGSLGFRLPSNTNMNSTFCAPKRCGGDDACGDLGRCLDAQDNGRCALR